MCRTFADCRLFVAFFLKIYSYQEHATETYLCQIWKTFIKFVSQSGLWVKKLKAKAYFSDANRAVRAVPIGMIASVGEVNGQRIALLKNVTVPDLKTNDEEKRTKQLYKQVAIDNTFAKLGR